MNWIMREVADRVELARHERGFLDVVFHRWKDEVVGGRSVVLFGAGGLGEEMCSTLRSFGIQPACFCDNNVAKAGGTCCGIPVISFSQLKAEYGDSLVLIASHKYYQALTSQLLENAFPQEKILCNSIDPDTPFVFMYSMIGAQAIFSKYAAVCAPQSVFDVLLQHEDEILKAYELLADEHSRQLYLSKLTLASSDRSFHLFRQFISAFSQPVLDFGTGSYEGTPEDYYYFNNDVILLSDDETYVDVGAYDGDTVTSFTEACRKNNVRWKSIYAFEPDPACYSSLVRNTSDYDRVECEPFGVWSKSDTLRFTSSEKAMHDQAGVLDASGDISVRVVSLDEFFGDADITFIKMDPGGNVIPEAVRGAANLITRCRPKLALGAYHSVTSMFEIPLLVHELCPDYRIYLRHNTYHLCDTDMLAVV